VIFTIKPIALASRPDKSGCLIAFQTPVLVIPVPCIDQAVIGMIRSAIANEYPKATPLGPLLRPNRIPTITSGVVAAVMLKARLTRPVEMTNKESGLANANTKPVGASNLKIGAASIHLEPSTTRTISSGNRTQLIVIGTVTDTSNE
jgi:hypothetical protein